jgi:hypothetical protein
MLLLRLLLLLLLRLLLLLCLLLLCCRQSFKTVSAAIGSHPGHMAVTLEFQRCADP